MKEILESWVGEKTQLMISGQGGVVGFEGKLVEVGDEAAVIQQANGIATVVRLVDLVAAHKIPSVTPAKLELVGPGKRPN